MFDAVLVAMRGLLSLQIEVHSGHRPLRRIADLEQFRRDELEHAGDEVAWESLLCYVEPRGNVIIELPREGNLILRARELFLQLLDVLIRLQVRVVLNEREQ